jgi:short-subunit dehydrogenase
MRIVAGLTVLITGASGGLGTHITEAFARRGVKLGLVAYPGTGLEELRQSVERGGTKAISLAADLRDPTQRRAVVEKVSKDLGPIDILINNAGVEITSPYHELSEKNICDVLNVNLESAMILARLVLPGMLQRGRGHIVSISSLAGKSGPALQEPYAASKAGLIAFTSSFRATYHRSGNSASVIVPAFVEAGIYSTLKAQSGCSAPWLLTGCSAEHVAQAVVRATERDIAELIVNRYPIRPVLMISALSPALGDWIVRRLGVHNFFRRAFEAAKTRRPAI